ncbi:MAG: thioredoxin [Bacteroidales bacterium]|nr:thioredoxin [Bacteroidales bacterium]MBR6246172.1 thioredoxin [Bacteroidales bacterium]
MVQIATNTNFEDIITGPNPVLVDMWAVWCGPCRMLSPTVDDIAAEHPEFTVVKCNVDDCDDIALRFGIRSIPTLLYIKDGEVRDRTVGVVSKDEILERLGKLL